MVRTDIVITVARLARVPPLCQYLYIRLFELIFFHYRFSRYFVILYRGLQKKERKKNKGNRKYIYIYTRKFDGVHKGRNISQGYREEERIFLLPIFGAAACLRSRQLEATGMTLLTKNVTLGCYRGRVNDKREIGSVSGILRVWVIGEPVDTNWGRSRGRRSSLWRPFKTIIEQKKPKRFRIDSNLITFPVSFVFIHMYSREIGRDKYGIGRDRNRRSEIRDPKIRD